VTAGDIARNKERGDNQTGFIGKCELCDKRVRSICVGCSNISGITYLCNTQTGFSCFHEYHMNIVNRPYEWAAWVGVLQKGKQEKLRPYNTII
jgi:hypothetical protein